MEDKVDTLQEPGPAIPASVAMDLLNRSLSARLKLRTLAELTGPMDGLQVLDLGGLGGALAARCSGVTSGWQGVDASKAACRRYTAISGIEASPIGPDGTLPFEDASFDLVIVTDRMEQAHDDRVLTTECHRVLKDNGRLAVLTPHVKSWGLLPPLRRLLRVAPGRGETARRGYTGTELFHTLRDGFDVLETCTFMRFPSGKIDAVTRWMCGLVGTGEAWEAELEPKDAERLTRIYRRMTPLAWLAERFDSLAFGTKGYHLGVLGRRRIWKTRQTPKLRDGRSIADATINTRIGSAAPF